MKEKQPAAARVFTRAIEKNRLAHAYLLEGPKGTGKMETAYLIAQRFFCRNSEGPEPCHVCSDCRRISSGNHPDVVRVEPEGQSIKKSQVETLIKEFAYKGVESSRKFFIIDKSEMMTTQAANSLLKFIEEPHAETMAVLLTENPHLLLETILSRCQVITFSPISREALEADLKRENIPEATAKIVSVLTNDLEEAVELCHEEWFAEARLLVLQFMEGIHGQSNHAFMMIYEALIPHFDSAERMNIALDLILYWYRDLLSVHLSTTSDIIYIDRTDLLQRQALQLSLQRVMFSMEAVLHGKDQLSANVSQQNVMEQLVLKLQRGSGNDL